MTTTLETKESPMGSTPGSPGARTWSRPHLLGLEPLSAGEIVSILDTARTLAEVSTRSVKKVPALRGKVCVNLFFEDSTRTKTSFSLAAQRLSADVIDFSVSTSSVSKGETLRDTARNIEAMGVDAIIIRHRSSGAPHMLTRPGGVSCSVINAGDGSHEHPTQGLLDLFTIREHFTKAGRLAAHSEVGQEEGLVKGLHVAIVGDFANSRVARSNLHGLCKLGAKVTLVGPSTLVPGDIRKICGGAEEGRVTIGHDLDAVLPHVDVVNMLRIQFERLTSAAFPSVREYSRFFGRTRARLEKAKREVLVLHPGPMNRGLEINTDVADGRHSAILQQVTNGLAVRMAVLYLCVGANAVLRGQRASG
jgi:aspartate carbamoyltransferase catalytic subunit